MINDWTLAVTPSFAWKCFDGHAFVPSVTLAVSSFVCECERGERRANVTWLRATCTSRRLQSNTLVMCQSLRPFFLSFFLSIVPCMACALPCGQSVSQSVTCHMPHGHTRERERGEGAQRAKKIGRENNSEQRVEWLPAGLGGWVSKSQGKHNCHRKEE